MSDYGVYVRVSTDKDEQISSIENQIDICRYWLERNDFEWKDENIYKDDGITGTILLARPAIQLLLEKARKKEIKMVLFKSLHRLARDLKDALEVREVFTAFGVRIISVEEGYDSFKVGKNDMSFEMHSMFADQYAKTTSAAVSAALSAKVRRGEHFAKVPFGYERIDKKLAVHPEHAKTVKHIFALYNSGLGYISVANRLNDERIPAPNSDKWGYTTIKRIINNPTYKGDYVANKYTRVKIDGKKKQIINPEEKWKVYENHHPSIISREEWEKANPDRKINKKKKISVHNEFRGIAFCSECGSAMTIYRSGFRTLAKTGERKYWEYMRCSRYRRYKEHGCVRHIPIQYKNFRSIVLEDLKSWIKDSRGIIEKGEGNTEKKSNEIKKAIAILKNKHKGLLDTLLDKLITKEEFTEKRHELDLQIQELEKSLFILQQNQQSINKVKEVKSAIESLDNEEDDLYETFKTLINKITISPNGEIEIEYNFTQDK